MEELHHHLLTTLIDGRHYAIQLLPERIDDVGYEGHRARRLTVSWRIQLCNPSEAEIGDEILPAAFALFLQDESPYQFAMVDDTYRRVK